LGTIQRPKRRSIQSPWQNGIAERWIGSWRREILDHVIALSEQHLRRFLQDFTGHYHQDRVHCGLENDTPDRWHKT
jgi:transposase InsO family protein